MIQRIHMWNIYEAQYKLPIASQYKIVNSAGETIGHKNYYKSWYKKLLKHTPMA